MPKVTNHAVIRAAIGNLDSILLVEEDGIAYAETLRNDGRYGGLVLGARPANISSHGLVVSPRVADEQLREDDRRARASEPTAATPRHDDHIPASGKPLPREAGNTAVEPGMLERELEVVLTRFHASKALDPVRVVRDISTLNDEIIVHFTAAGVPVIVTVDIDSEALDRLPADKRAVVRENLKALGFEDWSIE